MGSKHECTYHSKITAHLTTLHTVTHSNESGFKSRGPQTSTFHACFLHQSRLLVACSYTDRSQTNKYPNVLLIKPSIAAKRGEREDVREFVMDSIVTTNHGT